MMLLKWGISYDMSDYSKADSRVELGSFAFISNGALHPFTFKLDYPFHDLNELIKLVTGVAGGAR
jgi:hypothetical protein